MIYFQVHRTYVMRDDITDRPKDWKDQVGIARFESPLEARNFILRSRWNESDLVNPSLQWDCSHDEMVKLGWELDFEQEKEPTEAVDSGLLDGNEVPVVLRIGRGFAGINKIMAVLPTLPPNPWLYDHNPDMGRIPKMFAVLPDGGKFFSLEDLRPTEATMVDHQYHPILPATQALVESFGKKVVLCPKITPEHTLTRKAVYENAGDISMGNATISPRAHVASFNRVIDLG